MSPLLLVLALTAHASPRGDAMEALGLGREAEAVRVLQRGIAAGEDDEQELRCLLGRVQLQSGDPRGALSTLQRVDPEAACARRAEWLRAEALLALDRSPEAATLYEALGEDALGSGRDRRTAQRLVDLAHRLLERREPDLEQVSQTLALALDLDLEEAQALDIARELVDLQREEEVRTGASHKAQSPLLRSVAAGQEVEDRLRLAWILGGARGLRLLEPLPLSPQVLLARLELSTSASHRWPLVRELAELEAHPETRRLVGRELSSQGWAVEARALLQPLSESFEAEAGEDLWTLAELASRAGDDARAGELCEDLLARFPLHPRRAQAEALLARVRLRRARTASEQGQGAAEVLDLYDAAVSRAPRDPGSAQAAWEAAVVVWEAGQEEEAVRRWEEVRSRWPGTGSSTQSLRDLYQARARAEGADPAMAWLRELSEGGDSDATWLVEEMQRPVIHVASLDRARPGSASVRVRARNVEELEVRLHRVDPESWHASGALPSALDQLDVGITTPDRTWTVKVSKEARHRDHEWDLPISGLQPGLYSVTLATPEREARTLLQVSDASVLVRSEASEVTVAVLRNGRPAPGAQVVLRGGARVERARADARGLVQLSWPQSELSVLATTPGGPAMAWLSAVDTELQRTPTVQVDLDRAVYRPGDSVGFRFAQTGHEAGAWQVWLQESGGLGSPLVHSLEPGPHGTLAGELVLGGARTGTSGVAPAQRQVSIMARPPGADPLTLATFTVRDETPEGRSLVTEVDGEGATLVLREEDGQPAADVLLEWSESHTGVQGQARTDAKGRVRVAAPPPGLPWSLSAKVAGTDLTVSATRTEEQDPGVQVALASPSWRVGDAASLELFGQGRAQVRVQRLLEPQELEPVEDPFAAPLPKALTWDMSWSGPPDSSVPGGGVWQTVSEAEVQVDGSQVLDLPTDEAGSWRLVLSQFTGESVSSWEVVEDEPVLRPQGRVATGASIALGVRGEAALVSLECSGQRQVHLLRDGQVVRVPVPEDWLGQARIHALTASGERLEHSVAVQASLAVELEVEEADGSWEIEALVRDARGEPVAAEVVLRAVDTRLAAQVGSPRSVVPGSLYSWLDTSWITEAWAGALVHGGVSTPVAAALLEEAQRQDELSRALAARSGDLEDNTVAGVIGGQVPLSYGMGGLGSRGSGLGGGGYGAGVGGLGTRGYGSAGGHGVAARPLQGERARVLWAVVEAGPDGRVEYELPAPLRGTTWTVEAVAVAHGAAGRDQVEVRTTERRDQAAPSQDPPRSQLVSLALEADPLAPRLPGHAAVAARSALAALPAAADEGERQALLRSATMHLGAVQRTASIDQAPSILALMAEAEPLVEIPAPQREAYSSTIPQEQADLADRLALAAARARAGVPVGDSTLSRLLREHDQLDAEQSSLLGRTLGWLGREEEGRALVKGEGPQALLARSELERSRRKRKIEGAPVGPPPPVGDPARPAWIEAVAAGAVPSSWEALVAPPPTVGVQAERLPLAADGLPVRSPQDASHASCGPDDACVLRPGEWLRVEANTSEMVAPAGLELAGDPVHGGWALRAVEPGEYVVGGITHGLRPVSLVVHVSDSQTPSPVGQNTAALLARESVLAGTDPEVHLEGRALDDWQPHLRQPVARARFDHAVSSQASAQDLTVAFEDLRDIHPDESMSLEEVGVVARAYATTRPERSLDVWKVGLGAAYADEAGVAARVQSLLGPLAAVQVLHEVSEEYPEVPVVESARAQQPVRLLELADVSELPREVMEADVTRTDLRLMAASWDREFVALHPRSEHTPVAGARLAMTLLDLQAPAQAELWAGHLASQWEDHDQGHRLRYLHGLAAGAQGKRRVARASLRRVARESDSLETRARLALAQLTEAEGDRAGARQAYLELGASPDAMASAAALDQRSLVATSTRILEPGQRADLPLTVAGVEEIELRAWALDLRTLFLRDQGLSGVHGVQVQGLEPVWSGRERLRYRPHSLEVRADLPLSGEGAWLVHAVAGDQRASALVVRSELGLAVTDQGSVRRVTVTRRGRPAPGVQVRALSGGRVVAETTDLRGVALVPTFAPVLAFDGSSYAFSDIHQLTGSSGTQIQFEDELIEGLKQDIRFSAPAPSSAVRASAL